MRSIPLPRLLFLSAIALVVLDVGVATAIAVACAAITLIVGLHEFAHLGVARLLGIAVERYSIGFGPLLVSRRRWGTSWELRALPFGGFVELLGERNDAGVGSFARASLARRVAVIGAGPLSSLLAAPLLCSVPFLLAGTAPVDAFGKGLTLCGWILAQTGAAIGGWLPNAAGDPLAIPLSGLPGITYAAGLVAEQGIGVFFAFAGALSLSAGLLNALPIPPLDGGRIAFALIRSVAPRRGEWVEERIAFAGIVALLGLSALLAVADLLRIGSGSLPG